MRWADLRFPHHENERAQAVALGKTFANHWMHNGFVVDIEGEKMSKSLGNVLNLIDLLEKYDPRAYRMLLLQTHYRSPVKVGQDNIDASVNALAGLDGFAEADFIGEQCAAPQRTEHTERRAHLIFEPPNAAVRQTEEIVGLVGHPPQGRALAQRKIPEISEG